MKRSLIIPIYRSLEGMPRLLHELDLMQQSGEGFEVVFVDDGSPDDSREYVLKHAPRTSWRWKLVCHARNFGSFEAIRTGLAQSSGEVVAFMAADLQEPPELAVEIFRQLESGECDIAIGKRISREDGAANSLFSKLFWKVYRRLINPEIPEGGVDVFGCTRQVADTLLLFRETKSSLLAQLFWIGYRRKFVEYSRLERAAGKSAWSFRRKLSYMADSIFAFSDLPLKVMTFIGVLGLAITLIIAVITLIARLAGQIQTPGYTTLILVVTGSTALILIGLGIVGAYVWRTYENTKGRPLSIVSNVITP
jgi:glycosyltransferase involved in cell wall biosynthesis